MLLEQGSNLQKAVSRSGVSFCANPEPNAGEDLSRIPYPREQEGMSANFHHPTILSNERCGKDNIWTTFLQVI